MNRSDRPGVCKADGGSSEIVGTEFARACFAHDLLVRRPEGCEVELISVLDIRNKELARAVRLGQIDGEAEIHSLVMRNGRLTVHLGVRPVHLRHQLERAN